MMDGYNFEQERVFLSWCTETGIRIHPGLQLVFPKKPPTDRDTNSASSPQPPRILAFAARTAPSVAPLVNYRDEDYGSDHDYQDGGSPNELDTADAEGSKDYSGLRVISNLHIKDGTREALLGARKFPSMHAVVIRAIIGGYLQPLAKTPSIRHPL
ncbi:hypothetical protein FS842_008984 [Serendipita sp. 407]|nr:hypothetical protein FS842_008984 [Serendipita sp. 407]